MLVLTTRECHVQDAVGILTRITVPSLYGTFDLSNKHLNQELINISEAFPILGVSMEPSNAQWLQAAVREKSYMVNSK